MTKVNFKKADVDGFKVFYREAGAKDAPTILLLHGFPSASHMFRDLIPLLADRFHVVAPDLPGFGQSDMPARDKFTYTLRPYRRRHRPLHRSDRPERFAIYVFDYGAPTGFRIAVKHPERITAIISQNGNAYEEGLSDGWNPIRAYWEDASPRPIARRCAPSSSRRRRSGNTRTASPTRRAVSPDGYSLDNFYLARPGADEVQLDLFGDYKSNVALYPTFQNISGPTSRRSWRSGARTIRSSCRRAPRRSSATSRTPTVRFFDTGHFALETHADEIAAAIRDFLS